MLQGLAGWHALILVAVLLCLLPLILAVISIARSTSASGVEKAVWVLVSLLFPLVGPVLWFVIGRQNARGAQQST